jgi:hypothetical protein
MSDGAVRDEPGRADKPVADLVADMTSQVTDLVRKELEMAVEELKGELRQAAKAGGMLTGAALSGYLSLLFGSFALAWFLDRKLPRTLAFGLVAALHGTAAASLAKAGREQIKRVDPVPTQTIETLKENVDWAMSRTS